MERILSTANERIKRVASLKKSEERKARGLFLVEGIRTVRDNIDSVVELYIREDKVSEWGNLKSENVFAVSDAVISKLSDTDAPQGIIGVCRIPDEKPLSSDRVILLDGVSDPGNVGTVIRTAAASGYLDVVLLSSADPYSPKVVRSTMGGIFFVNIIRPSGNGFFEEIKKKGYKLYSLDMGGQDIFSFKPEGKFVVAVGSEAHGISKTVRENSDSVLALPMENVESLNAGVSASVAMYVLR